MGERERSITSNMTLLAVLMEDVNLDRDLQKDPEAAAGVRAF